MYSPDGEFGEEALERCPFYAHLKKNRDTTHPLDYVCAEGMRRWMFVRNPGIRKIKDMQTWFWEGNNWAEAFEASLPDGEMEIHPGIGVGIHFLGLLHLPGQRQD